MLAGVSDEVPNLVNCLSCLSQALPCLRSAIISLRLRFLIARSRLALCLLMVSSVMSRSVHRRYASDVEVASSRGSLLARTVTCGRLKTVSFGVRRVPYAKPSLIDSSAHKNCPNSERSRLFFLTSASMAAQRRPN